MDKVWNTVLLASVKPRHLPPALAAVAAQTRITACRASFRPNGNRSSSRQTFQGRPHPFFASTSEATSRLDERQGFRGRRGRVFAVQPEQQRICSRSRSRGTSRLEVEVWDTVYAVPTIYDVCTNKSQAVHDLPCAEAPGNRINGTNHACRRTNGRNK